MSYFWELDPRDQQQITKLYNPMDSDFEFMWAKKLYTIKAKNSQLFPLEVAKHGALKMAKKILLREDAAGNPPKGAVAAANNRALLEKEMNKMLSTVQIVSDGSEIKVIEGGKENLDSKVVNNIISQAKEKESTPVPTEGFEGLNSEPTDQSTKTRDDLVIMTKQELLAMIPDSNLTSRSTKSEIIDYILK